ncbi:MAG: hypothetical protein JKP98_25645 [Rhodobacteraceae bacterium]|nr:hypothetical protein [Paracoccaceae bacterium]
MDRGDLLALVEAPAGPALAARFVADPIRDPAPADAPRAEKAGLVCDRGADPAQAKAKAEKAGLVCDISGDRAMADADVLRFLPMDASAQTADLAAAMAEALAPFHPTALEAHQVAAVFALAADVPVEAERRRTCRPGRRCSRPSGAMASDTDRKASGPGRQHRPLACPIGPPTLPIPLPGLVGGQGGRRTTVMIHDLWHRGAGAPGRMSRLWPGTPRRTSRTR